MKLKLHGAEKMVRYRSQVQIAFPEAQESTEADAAGFRDAREGAEVEEGKDQLKKLCTRWIPAVPDWGKVMEWVTQQTPTWSHLPKPRLKQQQ